MAKIFYRITVIPNQAKFDNLSLWLPFPYGGDFKEVTIFPTPSKLSQENKFENKMAYFGFRKEEVGKSLKIEEKFELEDTRRNWKIDDFNLSDYRKNSDYQKYTTADFYIQSDSPVIQGVAKKIKGEEKNLLKVVQDIYNYVLSILSYGFPTFGLYTSLQAFDFRMVDCGGFSTLFSALCQAVGVPSRIVSGFIAKNTRNSGYHAWSEFMLPDGSWVPVDLAMTKLKKKDYFGKFYEERIIFCKGTDFSLIPPLPNKEKASILQVYYLRLNEGADIKDLEVDTEMKVEKSHWF